MADLPVVYVIRLDGDTSDAENLFVSKRITATGAEYSLSGPLAKAIEAAINAAMAWQPIETAPKDGTRMLGLFGGAGVAIFKRHDCGGRYEAWVTDEGAACRAPLKWMPLPTPEATK